MPRCSFLLMNMQWSATSLGTLSSIRSVMTNLQVPVLGQAEYTWLIFIPSGRLQCRSSTRWRTATRMKAPWLTTNAWARKLSTPSLASPATVCRGDSGNSGLHPGHVLGQWSASMRWNMDLRNWRKRVFTYKHTQASVYHHNNPTSREQFTYELCAYSITIYCEGS